MRFSLSVIGAVLAAGSAAFAGGGDPSIWPSYADESSVRISADAAVSTVDPDEKDYAVGDVDQDGDEDLVCVRKEPYDTLGRRRNVLFMNEGIADGHAIDGVLVDRSLDYASDADDGGSGFLDDTNDRDVVLVDVNGDGWLDLITTTAHGQGLAKTISHPRVYVNLGEDAGDWLGFRYEEARTPMLPLEPNFGGVAAGDVDSDGAIDLYHVDYFNTLEDRLWMNDGTGTFADETTSRVPLGLRESSFGLHAVMADLNDDGVTDIIKCTTAELPIHIAVLYNETATPGFFSTMDIVHTGSPYWVDVADLNQDGRIDLIVHDDNLDRYLLNDGNDAGGEAQFSSFALPLQSTGIGGQVTVADLNLDSYPDFIINAEDFEASEPQCVRVARLWRNNADGPNVTFIEDAGGVPDVARTGAFDTAAIDVNRDGWPDLVFGTCGGMSVWVAQPRLDIAYPNDRPGLIVEAGVAVMFDVQIDAVVGVLDESSALLRVSIDGSAFVAHPMTALGGGAFTATLPASACASEVRYYVEAATEDATVFTDPAAAPGESYIAIAADGTAIALADDLEGDTSGWLVENDPSLSAGAWEAVDPIGTFTTQGEASAPEDDADAGVIAFVTENGERGGSAGAADVDGGPTWLTTPVFDLAAGDAVVRYSRWFFCSEAGTPNADVLLVEVSGNDGGTWVEVEVVSGTDGAWVEHEFLVSEFVVPSASMRLRFSTFDQTQSPGSSITEAGVDALVVEQAICRGGCVADLTGDGAVNAADLAQLLDAWGAVRGHAADFNGDGQIDAADLAQLLQAWGMC